MNCTMQRMHDEIIVSYENTIQQYAAELWCIADELNQLQQILPCFRDRTYIRTVNDLCERRICLMTHKIDLEVKLAEIRSR